MIMTEFGAAKDTKYALTLSHSSHSISYLHAHALTAGVDNTFRSMSECVCVLLCRGDLRAVEETVKMADEWQQSWIYWQFKYFQVEPHPTHTYIRTYIHTYIHACIHANMHNV